MKAKHNDDEYSKHELSNGFGPLRDMLMPHPVVLVVMTAMFVVLAHSWISPPAEPTIYAVRNMMLICGTSSVGQHEAGPAAVNNGPLAMLAFIYQLAVGGDESLRVEVSYPAHSHPFCWQSGDSHYRKEPAFQFYGRLCGTV